MRGRRLQARWYRFGHDGGTRAATLTTAGGAGTLQQWRGPPWHNRKRLEVRNCTSTFPSGAPRTRLANLMTPFHAGRDDPSWSRWSSPAPIVKWRRHSLTACYRAFVSRYQGRSGHCTQRADGTPDRAISPPDLLRNGRQDKSEDGKFAISGWCSEVFRRHRPQPRWRLRQEPQQNQQPGVWLPQATKKYKQT